MNDETKAILRLLIQLLPENSAQYNYALFTDCEMYDTTELSIVRNWLRDENYERSIPDA